VSPPPSGAREGEGREWAAPPLPIKIAGSTIPDWPHRPSPPLPRAPLTRGEERERVGSGRLGRSTSKAADRGASIKLIGLYERLRRPLPTLSLSASRGERRLRLLSAARGEDGQAHARATGEHGRIPESQDPQSGSLQIRRPPFVISDPLGVLPSVDLDHKAGVPTKEVEEVGSEWGLAPPCPATQAMGPQGSPQARLSVGLASTKLSRSNDGGRPLYSAHFAHASDMNICRTSVQALLAPRGAEREREGRGRRGVCASLSPPQWPSIDLMRLPGRQRRPRLYPLPLFTPLARGSGERRR